MNRIDERLALVRHLQWADATIWQSLLEADEPTDAKVFSWLHHIHLVQHAFLRLWRGEPIELEDESAFPDAEALARWGRDGHGELLDHLSSLDEVDLDRQLEIPWTEELTKRWNRPIEEVTLGQSVLQVALHSTHHRGQVAVRLRELGGEPPMTDYIAWLWFGLPEPSWPGSWT